MVALPRGLREAHRLITKRAHRMRANRRNPLSQGCSLTKALAGHRSLLMNIDWHLMNVQAWNTCQPCFRALSFRKQPCSHCPKKLCDSFSAGAGRVPSCGFPRGRVVPLWGDRERNACTPPCSELFADSPSQIGFAFCDWNWLASYLCAVSASGPLFFTDLGLRCLLCTSPWTRYFGSHASDEKIKSFANLQSCFRLTGGLCLVQTRCLSVGSVKGSQGSSWSAPTPSNAIWQMGSHTYAEGRPLIHSSAQICCLFPNPINDSKLQVPSRFINSYVASISSTFYEGFLESWFITDWLPICRVHTF